MCHSMSHADCFFVYNTVVHFFWCRWEARHIDAGGGRRRRAETKQSMIKAILAARLDSIRFALAETTAAEHGAVPDLR